MRVARVVWTDLSWCVWDVGIERRRLLQNRGWRSAIFRFAEMVAREFGYVILDAEQQPELIPTRVARARRSAHRGGPGLPQHAGAPGCPRGGLRPAPGTRSCGRRRGPFSPSDKCCHNTRELPAAFAKQHAGETPYLRGPSLSQHEALPRTSIPDERPAHQPCEKINKQTLTCDHAENGPSRRSPKQ
jgi:hypothetical protein